MSATELKKVPDFWKPLPFLLTAPPEATIRNHQFSFDVRKVAKYTIVNVHLIVGHFGVVESEMME